MPTAEEYTTTVRALSEEQLRLLWAGIMGDNTPGWAAGKALEYLVLRLFEREGADVQWPYSVLIDDVEVEQIDGVVYAAGLACLIECKDTGDAINIEPIAKMRNQLLRRHAGVIGSVFSRTGFTNPARTLAQYVAPQTILLWTGEEIEFALDTKAMITGLVSKYRFNVEHGLPDYHIATATIA